MPFHLRTLLIVLVLGLPLLAALMLPAVNGSRPSPTTSMRITLSFFNDAIEYYRGHVGELPPDLESLIAPPRQLPSSANWGGPYLSYEKLPLDPWRGAFQYEVLDAAAGTFRVWSNGPDGRSHTNDDIHHP
jgi:general secretion pathway protein G